MPMPKVIPAINCHIGDFECVAHKAQVIESLPADAGERWAHIDVADGAFTFNKTWNDPGAWANLARPISLEVHLMVENPGFHVDAWLGIGAKRLILHAETIDPASFAVVADKVRRAGGEVMLALNPETDVHAIEAYGKNVSEFQLLAVHPGLAGQKFLPAVLEKVRFLRGARPDATIEVDGGINEETARDAFRAGANILVSASYLFTSRDPIAAYNTLLHLS